MKGFMRVGFGVAVLLSMAACGNGAITDEKDGQLFPDLVEIDIPRDNAVTDLGVRDSTQCEKVLAFTEPFDDDGLPSSQIEQFKVILSWLADRDLKVSYTDCSQPVGDEAVTFEIQNDTNGSCQLVAGTAYTDAAGLATVKVKATDKSGECFVKACLANSTEVCRTFHVIVDPKKVYPLAVDFDYTGANPKLDTAKVYVFKVAANGKPVCGDLKYDALPTASAVSQGVSLNGTAFFKTLPGLDEAHPTMKVTVVALAAEGTGPTKAWGCNDQDGNVEFGAQAAVTVLLKDIPPRLQGSYDITSTFDLVSGLPPQIANVLNIIIGLFQNPTGQIMMLMCNPSIATPGGFLEDLCGYVFNDPSNPQLDNLSSIGEIVSTIVNALLISLLESQCPFPDQPELCSQIYFTGKDIGDILKKFQLLSTMKCDKDPDELGQTQLGDCSEVWHTVVLKWTLGKDCPPDDEECGAMTLSLQAIPGIGDAISADIKVTLITEGANYKLAIDEHPVDLKYGALVNFAIEKILLPQVFGDGMDGLPAVDSYENLIGSLLAGKDCLIQMDCCETFAINLTGQTAAPGLTENLIEGACDALIATGGKYVRDMLTSLDATPQNFSVGTPADNPCAIADKNKDMRFDALGDKTNPCVWDAKLKFGSGVYDPNGTFYGKRQ